MNTLQALSLSLLTLAASCSSTPKMETVDNALLASASRGSLEALASARGDRDAAKDQHALSDSKTSAAKGRVESARAALNTTRSQLDETKLTVKLAEKSGTPEALAYAEQQHAYALSRADHAREFLAWRKREYELARMTARLDLERYRLSLADVELTKAQAVQGLDSVAAKKVAISDFRKQVSFHRKEVETATVRVIDAEERLNKAAGVLENARVRMESTNQMRLTQ